MYDRKHLIHKLSLDIQKLQKKIEHKNLYNIRNYVVKALLKSGIAIDYALPFIFGAILTSHIDFYEENPPFFENDVTVSASIETTDTSSGIHLERISHDFLYDTECIEYSTGWVMDEKGFYERTSTFYRLNHDIDISNVQKVLSMSKADIDNILVTTNIKTIHKKYLTPEDQIYNEEALVLVNNTSSNDITIVRKETPFENIACSALFILHLLTNGNNIRIIRKIFKKTYIRNKLRNYEPLFSPIDKNELYILKEILEIKKQNLAMLDASKQNINDDEPSYALRKVKGAGI